MQTGQSSFKIRDESGDCFSLEDLGNWAVFAFKLGYESFRYSREDLRLVTIVSVPSRELFTALVVLGALVADGECFNGEGLLTWEQLIELEAQQLVYFTDRNKVVMGYLDKFDEKYQARTIRDAKNALHFVTESSFNNYQIRFSSPKSRGSSGTDESLVLEGFKSGFNLNIEQEWLRTLKPNISLNVVKHSFIASISNLAYVFEEGAIPLSKFLNLTEVNKAGSGKVLVKSERNATVDFKSKLAILSSGSFGRLIRAYSHSDLVITLEHHEYDESIASLARSLRQTGDDSDITVDLSETDGDSLRVISKVMKRVV